MSSNWLKMVLFETQNLCEFSIFQNVKIIRHNNRQMFCKLKKVADKTRIKTDISLFSHF